MLRQIICQYCGLDFEVFDSPEAGKIFCPNCANEIDSKQAQAIETLGNYRLVKLLGQGGMGQVYSAVDPANNVYALKVMTHESLESPDLIERFEREMAIMAGLNHPNIVRVIDQGSASSFKYFVMELVEGGTLRQVIRDGGLTEGRIIDIVLGILRALGHAHAHGIIHRDIKPENIMFDRQSNVKVTDFGLARKFGGSSDQQSLTKTNAFMGTENYMSPEQRINPKAVTHKADIYAVGVVLYEMLTGGLLPLGIFQPPSCYKPIHQYWDTLTFRMLDLNPDMRPDNCAVIIEELERFQTHRGEPSSGDGRKREQPAAAASPAPAPAPPQPSLTNFVQAENERAKERLKKFINDAGEQFQAGNYAAALPLFEASLAVVVNPEDRNNVLEWMRLCREKIQEAKDRQKPTYMCPNCLKPFLWSEPGAMPESLACPLCHCILRFDPIRKVLRKQTTIVNKTPPSTDIPVQASQKKGMPGNLGYQVAFLVLVGLSLLDWFYPEVFEEGIGWLYRNTVSSIVGVSAGKVVLVLRFVMHLAVLVTVVRLAYILSGF